MKKSVSLLIATISVTALMTGCNILKKSGTTVNSDGNVVKTTTVTKQTATQTQPATDEFIGEWSITEILGEKVVVNGDNHPKLTFQLSEDIPGALMVIGFNGCNYINGTWKVTPTGIESAGAFASTMRSCPDAPYEFTMNKALDQVTGYAFGPDHTLVLKNESAGTVMTLRKRLLSFLNGECKIHGNAGCNLLNGDIIVNLDKGDGIEFKNLATTRMTCPDIATEQQFLLALEEVDTAVQGATPNEAVMKDAQGKVIITMHRISAEELGDM